jgi:phosphopantetheinyl transferase (holo-ACP synthase)
VDWKDPSNARKSRDSRYLKKILTNAEIDFVRNADNPDKALWALWTCKETAYKVIRKSHASASFLPRQWSVKINQTDKIFMEGKVIIPGENTVFVQVHCTESYVHCIGSDDLSDLDKIIWGIDPLPKAGAGEDVEPSLFVREGLIRKLSFLTSLNFTALSIRRTEKDGELQPPCVYLNNKKAPFDISLSHDGLFTAYAAIYAPIN